LAAVKLVVHFEQIHDFLRRSGENAALPHNPLRLMSDAQALVEFHEPVSDEQIEPRSMGMVQRMTVKHLGALKIGNRANIHVSGQEIRMSDQHRRLAVRNRIEDRARENWKGIAIGRVLRGTIPQKEIARLDPSAL